MNIKVQHKELVNSKNALKNEWMRKQLNIEIKTVEGSRYIDHVIKRKIKEYSLSSQKRRKFLMYCIRAKFENDYLLVTDLIKLIGISRAGAETMIKECEEANWIRVERCGRNRRKIQAADITVETYADYCDWLWEIINKSEIRNLSASINEIEKLERSFS
ncbi:MAG: MarR family transcriptional regulator [Paracoccaceae bacterium]